MVEKLVEQIEGRFAELSEQMANPEVIADRERYAEVGREYRALEPAHELAREWRTRFSDAEGAREMLAESGDDAELRELLESSDARLAELDEEIRLAMVEPDPHDDKNVIWRCARARAARRRGCSPATSTGCSPATPSGGASAANRCP